MLHHRQDKTFSGPIAIWQWGLVLLAAGMLLLAGCSGRGMGDRAAGESGSALADSLGLDQFLMLSPSDQAWRQNEAERWRQEADGASHLSGIARALERAVGLDPADPRIWLDLAEVRRGQGDYLGTSEALTSAAAAVRAMPGDVSAEDKREVQRRTATLRAWLHYDRAEYREALRWARAGEQASPGDIHIRRIRGLIEGSLGHRSQAREMAAAILRNQPGDSDAQWLLAVVERAEGRYREAFNYISPLRPDHEYSSQCYRDKGEIAEFLGEWAYARRWYAESAYALPFNDVQTLSNFDHPRLDPGNPGSDLPIWLARGRNFVAGSLSSYAALALARFNAAPEGEDREFWAGQVVDVTGILLRKEMHRGWTLRARGLVFGEKGMHNRALKDLTQAKSLLGGQPIQDGLIEAMIGHLHLVKEDQKSALPFLLEAVEMDESNARAWSDLGLCHIMAGDRGLAEEALTRAVTLEPTLATAWYNRGLMHLHAGHLDLARSDLEEAARLAPGNPEIAKLLQQVNLRKRSQ